MDKLAVACENARKAYDLAKRNVDKPAVIQTAHALMAAWEAYDKGMRKVK